MGHSPMGFIPLILTCYRSPPLKIFFFDMYIHQIPYIALLADHMTKMDHLGDFATFI